MYRNFTEERFVNVLEGGEHDLLANERLLDLAIQKAENIFELNRVQIDDFEDIYSKEKLRADTEYIKERKLAMAVPPRDASVEDLRLWERISKISGICEAMLIDPEVISAWYATKDPSGKITQEVSSLGTTEFDDVANGVDAVWEFRSKQAGPSYLALGIDVVYISDSGKHLSRLERKLARIKGDIEDSELAKIDYFMPRWSDVQGKLSKIPQTVVGVDHINLGRLANLWLKIKDNRAKFEMHPAQQIILTEISMQLDAYRRYAEKVAKPEIAEKISITENRINGMLEQSKNKIEVPQKQMKQDRVYSALESRLINFDQLQSIHSKASRMNY